MDSTPKPKTAEPNDVVVALADERLAHAYGQIARADEQLARVNEQLSKLEHDAPRHPSAVPGRRTSRVRPALRGLIGLLLAACIFGAAFVSQSSYGDAAKLMIGRWAPQLALTSSLTPENSGPPAQPNSPAVQAAVAESVPAQPTPSAQAAPQEVPPAVTLSPELTQLLQAMARDLAHVEQVVDQLNAGQAQIASDNAKAVEQLKASQEQMTRLLAKASDARASDAKASEQKPQPKTSASPTQPMVPPTRKPVPTPQSSQARTHPQAPTQLQPKQQ
jgi:pyruvate/2-oxoglutarate dehydrogenase complex dihydrolipoamide acyltransferase (E2) component